MYIIPELPCAVEFDLMCAYLILDPRHGSDYCLTTLLLPPFVCVRLDLVAIPQGVSTRLYEQSTACSLCLGSGTVSDSV